MKKISFIILSLLLFNAVMAQKYVPKIGAGSSIYFNVEATASGQQIPLYITVVTVNDPLKMKWELPGLGSGYFSVSAKGLQSGTKLALSQPAPDETTALKDDETVVVISKDMFASLQKNHSYVLNGTTFTAKDAAPYKINDKEADVMHVVSNTGKTEMWILNNPDFPVICKMTGNPAGIDLDITSVKE